jgi:hypothetical protein
MPVLGGLKEYRSNLRGAAVRAFNSIVVRYRPGLGRRVQEGDLDHMRVLIVAFLFVVERIVPEQFLETVSGQASTLNSLAPHFAAIARTATACLARKRRGHSADRSPVPLTGGSMTRSVLLRTLPCLAIAMVGGVR